MNTDKRQQIKTALQACSDADLRDASIGLLNTLGYQSEKALDLGGSPETFLEQFDNNTDQTFCKAMENKYDKQFRIVFEAITQLIEEDQKPKENRLYKRRPG
jgi:hypothetical protein